MTDRIRAALEAADKATPGPWVVRGDDCHYCSLTEIYARDGVVAETNKECDAALIRYAPDMAAEIVKLRKWQSEAVQYLDDALEYLQNQISVWKEYNRHKVYQSALDDVNRLIAEAEGE